MTVRVKMQCERLDALFIFVSPTCGAALGPPGQAGLGGVRVGWVEAEPRCGRAGCHGLGHGLD